MALTKLNYKQANKMSEYQLVIKDLIALVEKYSISEKGISACMISLKSIFDDEFTLIQQRIVGEKHLKIVVQKQGKTFDGIAFNIDVKAWPNAQAERVHLAYRLDVNEFRGKRTVQLMVESIRKVFV